MQILESIDNRFNHVTLTKTKSLKQTLTTFGKSFAFPNSVCYRNFLHQILCNLFLKNSNHLFVWYM